MSSYVRPPLTSDQRRRAAWEREAAAKRKPTLLEDDVAAMIADRFGGGVFAATDIAHDIVTVVRERVLTEIGTYARENVR